MAENGRTLDRTLLAEGLGTATNTVNPGAPQSSVDSHDELIDGQAAHWAKRVQCLRLQGNGALAAEALVHAALHERNIAEVQG